MDNLLNRSNKKVDVSRLHDSSGVITNTQHAITEKFNECFANIASNLKSNSGNSQSLCDFENYLTKSVPNLYVYKTCCP